MSDAHTDTEGRTMATIDITDTTDAELDAIFDAAAGSCRWCYSPIRPVMPYVGNRGLMFPTAPAAPPAGFCSALCAARDRGPRIVAPMTAGE